VRLQVTAPATATAGTAFGITVTARDAAGLVATSYRGRVTFTSTDTRSPVLPAAYTFTAADAGRHTFTGVRLFTAGSRTIAAFDTVRTTVKGRSGAIVVAPARASRLTVTAPATATAGVGVSVTVTAKDAWFNVATGDRGTVRFTSTDPSAPTLPAPYTFTSIDRGFHAFAGVVLKSAGSRRVTATDTVTSTVTGTTATIAVAPRYALYTWEKAPTVTEGRYPTTPTLLGADTRWRAVAAGSTHNAGIKSDGTLWTWGEDSRGQLGDGVRDDAFRSTPGRVGTRSDWAAVALGDAHTLALKTNGTLWAWGSNLDGQLGDGTYTSRSSPVQIGAGRSWRFVDASFGRSAAIATDGTLWHWGGTPQPQFPGDPDLGDRSTPEPLGVETHWASVSLGGGHVLAVTTDGSLWAMGRNDYGELGNGTQHPHGATFLVPGGPWSAVSAGFGKSFGLKRDGTLWAWGLNFHLELGAGVEPYQTVPAQIAPGSTWRSVSDGENNTVGVRSDGTLWVWGEDRPPARVGTSGGWVAASSGLSQILGLRSTISAP
jgi:hypothetical protein